MIRHDFIEYLETLHLHLWRYQDIIGKAIWSLVQVTSGRSDPIGFHEITHPLFKQDETLGMWEQIQIPA